MDNQNNENQHCELLLETIRLLKTRSVSTTIEQISKDTGLTTAWLFWVIKNEKTSPSVDRVVKLYEYLKGKPLAL